MEVVILKVVEGKGKTGKAKTGKKRFLLTDNTIDVFNNVVTTYTRKYKEKFPNGEQDLKSIRNQFHKFILKHSDTDFMEYEIEDINTVVLVANLTKLRSIKFLNIEETLKDVSTRIKNQTV